MVSRKITLYLFVFIPLLFSCEEQSPGLEDTTGRILIRLTDAPFPHNKVAQVNVEISEISIVTDHEDDSEAGTSEEYVIMKDAVETNLLDLTNGVTITLANAEIPAGLYKGIKVSVDQSSVVLTDQTIFKLNIGNWRKQSTEIFLPFGFQIKSGLTTDLLIDFDVSRSFVARTNQHANMGIAGFLFNPYMTVSDNRVSGTLTGLVTANFENKISRLPGAQILVYSGTTIYTTTFTDVSGMYTVLGLQPGVYRIETRYEGYESRIVEGIEINSGEYTRQSIRLKDLY